MIQELFEIVARIVHQGGVIAYPTEACFGLGCDPRNIQAIERIRKLKRRSPDQGFILVSDTLDHLLPYLHWDALDVQQRERITASWPGPISWLIPASPQAGPELAGRHNTLALRFWSFYTLRAMCRITQTALLSTSANYQGRPPLMCAADVAVTFKDQIDYIIDLPIQGLDKPSQIIDARTLSVIRS
jgi:L-threonylcarbamoyladenylate synthase